MNIASGSPSRAIVAGVMLVLVGLGASSETAFACCRNYQEFADACRAQGGVPSPNPATCSAPSNSSPTYDDSAARQRAEQERQRQAAAEVAAAEERARRERAEREARFVRERDAAANTMKGTSGTSDTELRGVAASDTLELRGVEPSANEKLRDAVISPPAKAKPAPLVACDRCERFRGKDLCWDCCRCQNKNQLAGCSKNTDPDAQNHCMNLASTSFGNCNTSCSPLPANKKPAAKK